MQADNRSPIRVGIVDDHLVVRQGLRQYLADFGHELFVIHLWGDEDRKPSHNGELELEDAETGESVKLNFDDEARAAYVEAFELGC